MANTYRATSARGEALYGKDAFEGDFTAAEEADQLSSGHLEIVPRSYEVLSNNYAAGKQGDVVDLALPVETEAALIQGGHIQRADQPTTKKKG